MKLVTFHGADGVRTGVVGNGEVADLSERGLPGDMAILLADADWRDAVERAQRQAPRRPLTGLRVGPPVPRPPKFLAIGLNYAAHVEESGAQRPAHQLWFNKQSTCVIGPGDPIHIPKASSVVDYEGELGFVIGRRCRHVPRERASEVIAGFTVVNDVSVRDWQFRTPTMTMGKSFDTHGPTGPFLVTPDEVGDPHALRLQTWVNDELRQDAKTDDLIFDCYDMVEHLSTAFTPPKLLKAGDVVRIEIEGVGTLENPVIDEPDETATAL